MPPKEQTIEETSLPGVVAITPPRFSDDRGWFSEVWNAARLCQSGIEIDFVQDNHSYSAQTGTLRGLHYQAPPRAQAKLVRCSRGSVFDIAVDIRAGSPTYGRWTGVELSAENGRQLLVPVGFLHGFVTLEPDSEVQYKCSAPYSAAHDGAVRWDSCGIDWPLAGAPILSPKDAAAPALADFRTPFAWEPAS